MNLGASLTSVFFFFFLHSQSYRKMLDEALVQNFPELGEQLMESSLLTATEGIKMEEDGVPNGV